MEDGLENVFFLHFSLVSMQFVVHTGGYTVIQVKQRRDIDNSGVKLTLFCMFGYGPEAEKPRLSSEHCIRRRRHREVSACQFASFLL